MDRRTFLGDSLKLGLAGIAAGTCFSTTQAQNQVPQLPMPRPDKLPRWRGFNLLEKFNRSNRPFRESDFQWIRDFGFNFVRLPMDYQMWIIDNDWRRINERVLEDIDEAVKFGEKYGIHVNMNFHRAPGYTVARPAEEKCVWTDPEALEVCILHWVTFAKRYKGIPNSLVSFNLFNEPDGVGHMLPQVVAAHKAIIAAIREVDPDRLIICDGYQWGTRPFFDLVDQKVAQSTRGYAPIEISHYRASWVNSADFPVPTWPQVMGNGLFMQPNKGGIEARFKQPMVIDFEAPLAIPTKLRMLVGTVSGNTNLVVEADGNAIFRHDFRPGPGEGDWEQVVFRPEWNVYQNIYNRNYEVDIPVSTSQVVIRAAGDDWLTLKELSLTNANATVLVNLSPGWNQPVSSFRYNGTTLVGGEMRDRDWLKRTMIEPWKRLEGQGVGVMVGEFGAFQYTPHDVALRWMADMLANWKEAGWGFALWNFRGSFGILDSGRSDIVYEDFHGRRLDRKMLQLLQEY